MRATRKSVIHITSCGEGGLGYDSTIEPMKIQAGGPQSLGLILVLAMMYNFCDLSLHYF